MRGANITTRPFLESDVPLIHKLAAALVRHHKGMFVLSEVHADDVGGWVAEYIDAARCGAGVIVVAEVDGVPCAMGIWKAIGLNANGGRVASGSTFVSEGFRRIGVATKLRALAFSALRDLGFVEMVGVVDAKNHEGLAAVGLQPEAFLYRSSL